MEDNSGSISRDSGNSCSGAADKKIYADRSENGGYDYFKTDSAAENDSTLVILDNEILYDKGRYIDGRLYLQQSFVQDNVNMRFYYDKESNAVLYRTGAQSIRIIRTSRGIGTRTVIRMIRSMK